MPNDLDKLMEDTKELIHRWWNLDAKDRPEAVSRIRIYLDGLWRIVHEEERKEVKP